MKKYMVELAHKTGVEIKIEYKLISKKAETKDIVKDYVLKNGLFVSEWCGGKVISLKTKKTIGYVAFNGKFYRKRKAKRKGLIRG